jgi:hypothetical protein
MLGIGRDYISLDATGDTDTVYARMKAIGDAIMATFGDSVSYRVKRVDSVERIEFELRDPETILAASGGHLPVLLVNITDPTGLRADADFEALVTRLGLRPVGPSRDAPS